MALLRPGGARATAGARYRQRGGDLYRACDILDSDPAGNILTDPIYSERAGPWNRLGPRRVRPPAIALDHCDLPTLGMLAKRFDPLVITPLGNGRFARAVGIRRVEELDWWQSTQGASVPITPTPDVTGRGILRVLATIHRLIRIGVLR